MIKDTNEKEYSLLNDDNIINKNNNNIIFFFGILFAMSVSTICSVYIVFIYQDIHDAYLSLQKWSLSNLNVTELYSIRNQLEFLNYCVSEKYCKRIH
jgi:hypothetical protein